MTKRQIEKLNREVDANWRSRFDYIQAKVGTVPMGIWVPNDTPLEVGGRIVFYEQMNGQRCTGNIVKLEPILFIDRM